MQLPSELIEGENDEHSTIVRDLELFGLTEREARVYLSLVTYGDKKASDLARELGIHRLDVYYALKSLQQKDMVEANLGRPMTYCASSFERVIEMSRKRQRDEFDKRSAALGNLEKAEEKLSRLQALRKNAREAGGSNQSSNGRIQVVVGRKPINEKWAHLVDSAESEILVAAIDKGSAKLLLMRAMDEISKKKKAGVRVRIFTPVTNSNVGLFEEVEREVRHLNSTNSAGVCIVDRKQALIIPETSNELSKSSMEDENAILIQTKSIVEMLRTLFFVGWDTSPSVKDSTLEKSAFPVK